MTNEPFFSAFSPQFQVLSRTARAALVVTLLLAPAAAWADAPVVSKVAPPNWWVGHTHNPVRLLLTGQHLQEASLKVPAGFRADGLRISDNGDYLLVNLHIPDHAEPGRVPLEMANGLGKTSIPFQLLPQRTRRAAFAGFSPDDVIYLVMTDRFANGDSGNDDPQESEGLWDRAQPRHYHGGDLRGLIQRLDYLAELGVTAIWLTPWYDNANTLNHIEKYSPQNKLSSDGVPSTDYHGYGAVDFYAVEEHFGDMATLQDLVDQAHARGLKVIQDQVANHTGPLHPWVRNPPTPTWYNGSWSNHLANSWQIWTTTVSNPPADQLKSTLEGWFIDILPDLNQDDPEVATYLIQNSLWWIGMTGVDAVRQDTMPYVPRRFWAQWTQALKRHHPNLTILGEVLDGNPKSVAFYQGGARRFDGIDSGVDTLFDFPLFFAIQDVFAGRQPMTRLTDTLAADSDYVDASVLVTLLGLHDKPRFLHRSEATIEGLKLAFTFLATTRGTPLLYYGDEVAMTGGGDPDNRKDFPGGWPGDTGNAFDPTGRTPVQTEVHDHVAKLLSLRKELAPLRRGPLTQLTVDAHTYAFARTTSESIVVVAFNNAPQEQTVDCSIADLSSDGVSTLTDRLGVLEAVPVVDGRFNITLPPRSAAILTSRPALARADSTQPNSPKPGGPADADQSP